MFCDASKAAAVVQPLGSLNHISSPDYSESKGYFESAFKMLLELTPSLGDDARRRAAEGD
jgi:hypothetical protein